MFEVLFESRNDERADRISFERNAACRRLGKFSPFSFIFVRFPRAARADARCTGDVFQARVSYFHDAAHRQQVGRVNSRSPGAFRAAPVSRFAGSLHPLPRRALFPRLCEQTPEISPLRALTSSLSRFACGAHIVNEIALKRRDFHEKLRLDEFAARCTTNERTVVLLDCAGLEQRDPALGRAR